MMDNRLKDKDFFGRFGKVRAMSISGPYVASAILRDGRHIYYDWTVAAYVFGSAQL